jgi:bacillithiol biosynthesis deacetylase BshB1
MQTKVDILAIGVHPDDVELSCSGTIAKQIHLGSKVAVLDLTKGELGTRGNPELREIEAKKSAEILGLSFRKCLDLGDGTFENNFETRLKIIEVLRACQPRIVLANAIEDRHPDHGRAAKLISESCFYSGLSKIETYHQGQKQEAFRPTSVYHYVQDYYLHPTFCVDVSDFIEVKLNSIKAFSSQFYNPDSNEPETPISSKEFLETVMAKMQVIGRQIGVKYAEGFISNRIVGVNSLDDLS